jgi:catechol 2,3-dioxygenase-like lactoylglutathione lyase family enzyme
MNITGLDHLVFGVDDVAASSKFLIDYGLKPQAIGDAGGVFEALDGTSVVIRHRDDPSLPAPLATGNMLRETGHCVADAETLNAIHVEVSRDREVSRGKDGSVSFVDDLGFALRFSLDRRRTVVARGETINSACKSPLRGMNELGVYPEMDIAPRTLSHVVYFVPDVARLEAFYTGRLGFRTTDRLLGVGPFLRSAGTPDHHTLFFIQTPPHKQGIEHFAFHMAGPTGLMLAGTQLAEKGYRSFWGPGRHKMGSNWFWYFDCPMGCHAEYDADMDLHDDAWAPRSIPISPDASQAFLFQAQPKWVPVGPPPSAKGEAEGAVAGVAEH